MQTFEDKDQTTSSAVRARTVAGAAILILPLLAYAVIGVRTAVNIPLTDDYDAIGWWMEGYAKAHGFLASAWRRKPHTFSLWEGLCEVVPSRWSHAS